MRRLSGLAVGLALAAGIYIFAATRAFAAGPYTEALSQCLVRSTTSADKTLMVQWIFVTMALQPDVKSLAAISDAQRTELNKKTAALFEQLLTSSCVSEARQALKEEGQNALGVSFNVLGQAAAVELFANPAVAAGIRDFGRYIDAERVQKELESRHE
jgi:hypothetical protein